MANDIEISVGDVTDMEAHIYAHYLGNDLAKLSGKIRGPFCENTRTLPAEYAFRQTSSTQGSTAEAVVTDPCLWSAELPHMYRIDVQATRDGQTIAEYHGTVGLQRLAPRRAVDFAPGTG